MRYLGLNELRREFLNFFESKGHHIAKSFSLIPEDDPSVLLVNAGMQPLKKYFTGAAKPPKNRMATCQKCFRTIDIDNVGYTARHATMFEMLGNFSFGDYFKRETISWGWEFLTKVIEIDPEKLWPSVYLDDEEAFNIWKDEIGIPAERITKLGKDDNFWEIGTGPCGPCSEIYYDRGEEYGCGSPDCRPGCDCERFTEIWNHVFSEFDRQEDGSYEQLKQKNIDTGMGLERLALVVQNVDSIFEIDTIKAIYDRVIEDSSEEVEKAIKSEREGGSCGCGEGDKKQRYSVSAKIVTDHIKSTVFLIGDGVNPSNDGRGYVLRRVFRRASRHAMKLGVTREGIIDICKEVIAQYGGEYDELREREEFILKVVEAEYDRFNQTLEAGINILEKWASEGDISGHQAFMLYDTYGFPAELTKEILAEKGMSFDEVEFKAYMERQKTQSREATKTVAWDTDEVDCVTEFRGYDCSETEATVEFADDKEVTLDETPFYAESGGQVSDKGRIEALDGSFVLDIDDVRKNPAGAFMHAYTLVKGRAPKKGDRVLAKIDMARRRSIMRNHSATHLLHAALRKVLGDHVHQAGSLVDADRLRFDFTHFEAMSSEQLKNVEHMVNDMVLNPVGVTVSEMSKDEAIKAGAMALFGEKYGDRVRVIKMGDYSIELCGGTHLSSTSEVGLFKIVSESAVAAGVRRIEAITGAAVYELLREDEEMIEGLLDSLKTRRELLAQKADDLVSEKKAVQKENEALKQKLLGSSNEKEEVGKFALYVRKLEGTDNKAILALGDSVLSKDQMGVFIAESDKRLVVMVAEDAAKAGAKAGDIVKKITGIAGGRGGGRPTMAQGGIDDESKFDEAVEEVRKSLVAM